MSVYDSITKGLHEAIEYEQGDLKGVRKKVVRITPLPHYTGKEIKDIRLQLKLTQSVFADLMGVSIKTVEAWEAGKNIPQGPAQRMLEILVKASESDESGNLVTPSIWQLIGLFDKDAPSNVAEEHNRYLAEIPEEENHK